MNDKYSLMKYIKDQNHFNKEELKDEMTLKAFFNYFKTKKKCEEFKKKCGQRIIAKCQNDVNIMKLKFLRWYKINKMEKVKNACKIIQRNYSFFKRNKNKNK